MELSTAWQEGLIAIGGGLTTLASKLGWDKARGNDMGSKLDRIMEKVDGVERRLHGVETDMAFIKGRFKERDEKE